MKKFFSLWFPVFVYAGIIFYFSNIPGKELPSVWISDKIMHLIEYTGFGFLMIRAIDEKRRFVLRKALIYSIIIVLFYGLTDEIHQSFVPSREFSFSDLFYDCFGGLIGGLVYRWIK